MLETVDRKPHKPDAPSGENNARKGSLTRRDVLKAATRLIRQQGYHGTSVNDIAVALSITKSSLYHHIKSKQDMLFQILDEAITSVSKGLVEISSADLPPTQKISLAMSNHILNLVEHRESVSVLLQERNSLESPYLEVYLPKRKSYELLFRRVIQDGIASGEFRSVDPKTTTLAILGLCNWLVQWYDPEGELSPQTITDSYIDLVMRMLRP